ncbi:C4-dicarboxylate ABC transporter [Escherichia albertii]|nr:C4-dicarboxylate ABC transporter [Escherichia albertii]
MYKNSNINVLMVVFIDFNQHSLLIYSAYFFFNF